MLAFFLVIIVVVPVTRAERFPADRVWCGKQALRASVIELRQTARPKERIPNCISARYLTKFDQSKFLRLPAED
jgi:hypothetical protein